jgi:AraC-like DNA-binding protein
MDIGNNFTHIIDDVRISLAEFTYSSSMRSSHAHNTYEIYYLYAGERYFYLDQTTYHLKKGDLVLIHAYDRHRTIAAPVKEHQRFIVMMSKEALQNLPLIDIDALDLFHKGSSVLRLSKEEQAAIEHLLFRLLYEHEANQPGFQDIQRALLIELVVMLHRHKPIAATLNVEIHQRAAEIMRYLNANHQKSITIVELSQHFSISRYHLSRIFKSATGFTIIEYINHVRLLEARQLLCSTKFPISHLATMLGFGSLVHFERLFKKSAGMSPKQYRNLLPEWREVNNHKEDT